MIDFFRKLFGEKEQPVSTMDGAETAPLSPEQIQEIVDAENPNFEPMHLVASSGQSVGKQRELNEDSLLTGSMTI
ncbi:MAG: hypothetical protein L3J16_07100, partial [Anaerolineales bacterium]|nr:hypothetical protein [Anaerolineales bacterium]